MLDDGGLDTHAGVLCAAKDRDSGLVFILPNQSFDSRHPFHLSARNRNKTNAQLYIETIEYSICALVYLLLLPSAILEAGSAPFLCLFVLDCAVPVATKGQHQSLLCLPSRGGVDFNRTQFLFRYVAFHLVVVAAIIANNDCGTQTHAHHNNPGGVQSISAWYGFRCLHRVVRT